MKTASTKNLGLLGGIVTLAFTALAGCATSQADVASLETPGAANVQVASATKTRAPRAARRWDPSSGFKKRARSLDEAITQWTGKNGLVTADGSAYAADVVPVLLYAARTKDAPLYDMARKGADRLILMEKSDPYTQGFVLTRRKGNAGPETVGATETLQMARALWEGADALNRPGDRELALKVLGGYSKFAYEMNGIWLVRKQFDFATRSFAGTSLLSNYDGDFIDLVSRKAPRAVPADFARRSYALVARSVTPSGLLYPLVQPEIGATYPGLEVDVYAPNGIVALEESCRGAVSAAKGQPQVARGVLEFARTRAGEPDELYAYFGAEDGKRTADDRLSDSGYACLATLAITLGDGEHMETLEDALLDVMDRATGDYGKKPGMIGADATVLLAAQAAGAVQ
jgi:hypothetical protein